MKLEFSWQILEQIFQCHFKMKIRPVAAKLFHADGRTDRHTSTERQTWWS